MMLWIQGFLTHWYYQDWKFSPWELHILQYIELCPPSFPSINQNTSSGSSSPISLSPPNDFLKLNFDGASKGNLGPSIFGGAFHNATCQLMWIYSIYIAIDTNNATKLQALETSNNIMIKQGFHMLIVEGYSQLVIIMLRKL